MNEYMLELVNGWEWIYADDYHKEPATATHDARYHFTRGMRTVKTVDVAKVVSITKKPKTITNL
jgi:hypothetical protein